MAQHRENRSIDNAVELLKENGFDGLAEAVSVLLNAAMLSERSEYLGAAPYERSAARVGYANGIKDKTVRSRLGELSLKVPQTREGSFYPQSLKKGLRSERALLLAIAEMYVQGVSTRRVKKIVEELCGMDVSTTQVSRAAAELDEMLEAWRSGSEFSDGCVAHRTAMHPRERAQYSVLRRNPTMELTKMFTRKLLTTAIALTGSIWTFTVLADTAASAPVEKAAQVGKISEWMGKEVKDQQGNSVGDIADFAVNLKDATIPYAVVKLEGMFNSQHIAVPLSALSVASGDDKTLSLAVSEAQWKAARTFGNSDWPMTATLTTGPAVATGQSTMPAQMKRDGMMSDQDREFKTMDRDGDGFIDRAEFSAFELTEQKPMSGQEQPMSGQEKATYGNNGDAKANNTSDDQ